jgi:glycosyltransferase involved in cell wall biosynthesis
MTILIINQHPQDVIGGSEIQCDLIATQLTRCGHQVVYFAVNGKQSQYHTIYPVEPGSLGWRELRRVIQRYAPDLVYWRFNKRKFLASMILFKWMRVKVVFAIAHINDTRKWAHKVRLEAVTWRARTQKFAASIRPALASRLNYLGFYGVDGVVAQLQQQTGKLPVPREVQIANSVAETRTSFHWPRPFIVWIATIKTAKNPDQFIELARHLQDAPVDFLMVGRICQAGYEDLRNNPHPSPNFYYLGEKSYAEVNGILQQALFLVHTCAPEGFPNIFIQAWLQGKPTVSLFYDPDDMIRAQNLGYLSGNFEQFLKDTQTLLDNEQVRAEMGQRAQRFAAAHFNLGNNVRALEMFFKHVCKQ